MGCELTQNTVIQELQLRATLAQSWHLFSNIHLCTVSQRLPSVSFKRCKCILNMFED